MQRRYQCQQQHHCKEGGTQAANTKSQNVEIKVFRRKSELSVCHPKKLTCSSKWSLGGRSLTKLAHLSEALCSLGDVDICRRVAAAAAERTSVDRAARGVMVTNNEMKYVDSRYTTACCCCRGSDRRSRRSSSSSSQLRNANSPVLAREPRTAIFRRKTARNWSEESVSF